MKKQKEDIEQVLNLFKGFVKTHRPVLDIETVATGEIAPRLCRDCAEIAPRSRRDRAEIVKDMKIDTSMGLNTSRNTRARAGETWFGYDTRLKCSSTHLKCNNTPLTW